MNGWRDISTAPRNGDRIIIGYDEVVVIAYWDKHDEAWCENDYDNLWHGPNFMFGGPTHWMPLPNPPE